jgi:hypothetical protein
LSIAVVTFQQSLPVVVTRGGVLLIGRLRRNPTGDGQAQHSRQGRQRPDLAQPNREPRTRLHAVLAVDDRAGVQFSGGDSLGDDGAGKHAVLGLIFLKYISDAFEAKHAELASRKAQGADPEDPDEYRAVNIFWVPPEARWAYLKSMAPQPTIGQLVDDAMSAIERDNPSLKGVLPKDFARPGLDKQRFGQIINLVSDIALGAPADKSKDTLGRVYEYSGHQGPMITDEARPFARHA